MARTIRDNRGNVFNPRKGLEGPFKFPNGQVLYYDPTEQGGRYWDPLTDMYLDRDIDPMYMKSAGSYDSKRQYRPDPGEVIRVLVHGKPKTVTFLRFENDGRATVQDRGGRLLIDPWALRPGKKANLRDNLIRLAHENPHLRSEILPLIRKASVISPEMFDQLRSGQRIWMTVYSGYASGEKEFQVGRTSYSRKYDVYSKQLFPVEDGVPVKKGRAKWTMYKRPTGVSVGHGGMGTVIKKIRVAHAKQSSGKVLAQELLFSKLDRNALRQISRNLKNAGDKQTAKLLRDIQIKMIERLNPGDDFERAFNRLSGLAARGQSWEPSLIRNSVFKIADELGISLPSGIF